MGAPVFLPKLSAKKPQKPLAKWQVDFATWMATSPELPSREKQRQIAEQFKLNAYDEFTPDEEREGLPRRSFYDMLSRKDFQTIVAAVQTGGMEAARAQLMQDLPEYVNMHMWGAKRAKEKDDIKTLATFTGRALDVVAPRKGLDNVTAQAITINISPAALQAPTAMVEAEIIELPVAVEANDDDT